MTKLTISIPYYNNEGDKVEAVFPAMYEVCERCEGTGKHVNPNIDGHGLSQEDFDADPDFREDYFAGCYDITCMTCKGERVVLVIDHSRVLPELKQILNIIDEQEEDAAASRRESEMERRMGA